MKKQSVLYLLCLSSLLDVWMEFNKSLEWQQNELIGRALWFQSKRGQTFPKIISKLHQKGVMSLWVQVFFPFVSFSPFPSCVCVFLILSPPAVCPVSGLGGIFPAQLSPIQANHMTARLPPNSPPFSARSLWYLCGKPCSLLSLAYVRPSPNPVTFLWTWSRTCSRHSQNQSCLWSSSSVSTL